MFEEFIKKDKAITSNYYNSELSEFIGKECKKVMTSIDIDILQVKTSRNMIRFIESKHIGEKLGDQQHKALKTLGWIARQMNKNQEMFNNKTMQVYLVRGNRPYEHIGIYDFVNFKNYELNDVAKIKEFLQCDYDLNIQDISQNLFT